MNWEAIGALGEVFGSIGVLLTLGYLAMQIRQNTHSLEENRKYAKAQIYQARSDAVNFISAEIMSPAIFAKLVTPDGLDFDKIYELAIEEQVQLRLWVSAMDNHTDNVLRQRDLGLLDATDEDLNADDTLHLMFEISRRMNSLNFRPSTVAQMRNRGIDIT